MSTQTNKTEYMSANGVPVAVATTQADHAKSMVFPIGEENVAFVQYFVGNSYLAPVETKALGIYNVTFEPKCRNHWHIHQATKGGGQILIGVAGRGFYQTWGEEPKEILPGTVITIPAGVKHWHGADADHWFSHLAIEVPGEDTSTEWLEPVSDEQYFGVVTK
ncbi:cupin domain-containing protein [Veillonella criceti]|uniref:Cupin domain n=1 Tax=Veillonella criceti TaxID=103891 RepID=A0A380NG74_9FIRM|nr:cupin domain-containing protein [Veillonella criceti]SUP40291.1 Uncharacterised protein [Veillonella criceti]